MVTAQHEARTARSLAARGLDRLDPCASGMPAGSTVWVEPEKLEEWRYVWRPQLIKLCDKATTYISRMADGCRLIDR